MASNGASGIPRVLVIGGCGFLGSYIVQALVAHPSFPNVFVASRSPTRNLVDGAEYHACDISMQTDFEDLLSTVRPTIIINTASPLAKGSALASFTTTIEGTRMSLTCASKSSFVKAYIYISSCSVVSGMPFSLVTESAAKLIDPARHFDPYVPAKATADALVLAANDPSRLLTAVLRPSGIVGERDAQVIPGLLNGMKQGMARVQLGDGRNKFDFVYAGNVADACVRCAEALIREDEEGEGGEDQGKKVSGEAFFITNGEPIEFWGFARLVWGLAGDRTPPEKVKVVPMWLMFFLSWIAEWYVWIISAGTRRPEKFNRLQMENCSMDRTFDISKARERLQWKPRVSLEEGARRSVEWALNAEAEEKRKKNV